MTVTENWMCNYCGKEEAAEDADFDLINMKPDSMSEWIRVKIETDMFEQKVYHFCNENCHKRFVAEVLYDDYKKEG